MVRADHGKLRQNRRQGAAWADARMSGYREQSLAVTAARLWALRARVYAREPARVDGAPQAITTTTTTRRTAATSGESFGMYCHDRGAPEIFHPGARRGRGVWLDDFKPATATNNPFRRPQDTDERRARSNIDRSSCLVSGNDGMRFSWDDQGAKEPEETRFFRRSLNGSFFDSICYHDSRPGPLGKRIPASTIGCSPVVNWWW